MGLDIRNFYLGTPMAYLQYIHFHTSFIPQEVMDQYDFTTKANGYVDFEIQKGMYGLKEAGIIAFAQLVQKLAPFVYETMKFIPGIWRHTTCKTTFTICVDDLGVKYFSKNYALHLVNAVTSQYRCTIDWTGSLYYDLNLEWNYIKVLVNVTMKYYVRRALYKFRHVPSKNHNTPLIPETHQSMATKRPNNQLPHPPPLF